jgi:hypothetical protein
MQNDEIKKNHTKLRKKIRPSKESLGQKYQS